ncbi:MAG TPA: hypothetical protein VKU87_09725 [Thermomicrobiaceae bacterium]|nr:hypothetical protein [Thermomicrobiaceae bacterium]
MAINKPASFVYHPHLPDRASVSLDDVTITYDDTMDALYVDFMKPMPPAVSIDVDDSDIYARTVPDGDLVVGMQIENFLVGAVLENPALLIFAELAGISAAMMEEVRAKIDPLKLKQAALSAAFEQLKTVEDE